ncbi:MAG: GTP-binding protein [Clostridia bacterium]|nr:GTP-binding protein [Clostridia bacterium]
MKTTKVDIFSGFLGAGKTTLIKKLIKEAYRGEMLVVIENEFGKIGIDGGFLQEAGIQITEMNSGCICCSLVGDFGVALGKVKEEYDPDRIVIEPSGVGKLSDVIRAVRDAGVEGLELNAFTTVIDASKCAMYMKNFAEFYRNQIEFASSVIFSRTDGIREDKLADAERIVREINPSASLITTPWDRLDGRDILDTMEKKNTLEAELLHLLEEEKKKDHHHHHHHDDGEECDDPECECHHHHDDDDDDDHEHHHHHHHDHDADEVFTSWGIETAGKFTEGEIDDKLDELLTGRYGMILRAKGIVDSGEGEWVHFDYVPGEKNVRRGPAGVTGKLCVIGTGLDKKGLAELFT